MKLDRFKKMAAGGEILSRRRMALQKGAVPQPQDPIVRLNIQKKRIMPRSLQVFGAPRVVKIVRLGRRWGKRCRRA